MPVIAYFGPAGTFTEMALDRMISERVPGPDVPDFDDAGHGVEKVVAPSPAAAIGLVRDGSVDYACVPIESSLEGSVPVTMDALVPRSPDRRVQVFAETSLDIAFAIAAREQLDPAQVRTIAAYPVASAQVRDTVQRLFPAAEFVSAASNAAAAVDVAAGRADAAITTSLAAGLHDLRILADGVADADDAKTRFLLVGRPSAPPAPTGSDRTAVILDLPNTPGSLMAAMNEFASRQIDLTRIESRPRRDLEAGKTYVGQYRFFLDAVGHISDDAVGEALRALHRTCERVTFLGSWPARGVTGAPPPDTAASRDWYEGLLRGEES